MTPTTEPQQVPEQLPEPLDLRGTPCPLNFVRTKLRLQQLQPGTLLEVWLDAGEPVEQVPDSLTLSGYAIAAVEPREGFFALRVYQPVEG